MAGRNQIVVDSSVVVKWFSEEEKQPKHSHSGTLTSKDS